MTVYFIGAGPGDPDLLTIRGRRLIERCPVCLYAGSLVPAEVIALLYQHRYQIELFFRFFKSLLGCRHLISQSRRGIEIQVYCAIIACMLLNLYTGRRPTRSTLTMLYWHMTGLASEEELMRYLNRPDNTGVKLRAKDELWKKLGN